MLKDSGTDLGITLTLRYTRRLVHDSLFIASCDVKNMEWHCYGGRALCNWFTSGCSLVLVVKLQWSLFIASCEWCLARFARADKLFFLYWHRKWRIGKLQMGYAHNFGTGVFTAIEASTMVGVSQYQTEAQHLSQHHLVCLVNFEHRIPWVQPTIIIMVSFHKYNRDITHHFATPGIQHAEMLCTRA